MGYRKTAYDEAPGERRDAINRYKERTGKSTARRAFPGARVGGDPRANRMLARTGFALPVTAGNDLLYGRNAVLESLRGQRTPVRLWLAEGLSEDPRIRNILRAIEARGAEVERVDRVRLDDAFSGANHQGVALETEPYPYTPFGTIVEGTGTVLMLDHLQDPQNFGALLRAAEAAGVTGVVFPDHRAVAVTPAVVNASAGAVEHLRIATVPNLTNAIETLKKSGRWVIGLDGGEGASDLYQTDAPLPAVLVVGAEGDGLSTRVRANCDLLVSLPMRGAVDSLNAATAGAIVLYELVRREQLAVQERSDS